MLIQDFAEPVHCEISMSLELEKNHVFLPQNRYEEVFPPGDALIPRLHHPFLHVWNLAATEVCSSAPT
jgi:hypothetical protein